MLNFHPFRNLSSFPPPHLFFPSFLGNRSPYAIGPLSVWPVCLSCPVLSVTFVHCDQTVGRIKMKLGTQVGLDPGHIVLDADPAFPP